jgi:hypothetical protein
MHLDQAPIEVIEIFVGRAEWQTHMEGCSRYPHIVLPHLLFAIGCTAATLLYPDICINHRAAI